MTTKKFVLSSLFILSVLTKSYAQETPDHSGYRESCYAYWGYGWGGQKTAVNVGFVLELKYKIVMAISLQGTRLAKTETVPTMSIMGTAQVSPVKQKTSGSSSLLFGKILKQPWGHFLLMAGPSLVMITQYKDLSWYSPRYSGESTWSPGVSLQANVTPSKKFIGLGVNLFANINSEFTHGGVTFNIVLGRVNYNRIEDHR